MAIDLDVHGNTKPLEAAVQAAVNRIRRQPIKITIDDKGATQPLGNMKRGADEFTKSMEAANARILAFGASMAIINGVGNAFKGMVKNLVEVEKSLADINVVMGLSAQNLDKFSDGLFKVAKETGAAFRVAADAATEYARQGLGVEESLKRTRDALVLTRLTGMDSAEAVKSLTAAMNTYGNQIKDTTQLVSKFAAVDVKFAVSAEDFADAISRTGQSAKTAGVSIDELVGIVTSAQQQTARGGAVIGNALKTIFTKTGRTDTLNQLENLGIAVRDLEGNTLGAKRILSDLANTFDKLSEAQKAQITQTMGGLFHINILKAVLSDAAKQNGIMAEATRISAGATDEAIQKNEELRKTMSAVATETGLAIKQVSAQIGEIALAPGMEKILNTVKSLAEGLSGVLGDGESTGSSFATGFLKGIGNVITGPGLVVLAGVFFKLFGQALKFTKESLTSLVGVTTEKQKQKAIQTSLVALFGQNAALNKEMLRTDIGRTEKEKIILGLLKAQVVEANALNKLTAGMAGTLYRKGYGANLTPIGKKASGHIPNFANPERAQAAQGGYAAGSIRTMNMPGEGPVIYNSAETVKNFAGFKQPAIMPPQSSKAGKNYQQAFGSIHGFDPYAAGGYIPNFALNSAQILNNALSAKRTTNLTKIASGERISSQTFSPEQQAAAAAALRERSAVIKTTANSSQLKDTGAISLAAMLVPKEGYRFKPSDTPPFASYGTGKDKMTWPVYTLKSQFEKPTNLTDKVKKKFELLGSKYSTEVSKLVGGGNITTNKFWKEIENDRAGGGKGAWKAAVGAIFEAAINAALGYEAASGHPEQGNFDVRSGEIGKVRKLFNMPAGIPLADYKSNAASSGNRKSFRDKVLKEGAFKAAQMKSKTKAYGHIPNFADPLSDAIGREKAAGVPVSQIRVGSHGALMNKSNPLGLGVTNTHDEPNGLRDVFGANGFVPNYAFQQSDFNPRDTAGQFRSTAKLVDKANKHLSGLIDAYKKGKISHEQLIKGSNNLNQKYSLSASAHLNMSNRLNDMKRPMDKMKSGFSSINKKFGESRAGKMLGSTGGQMGLMMGLPMAGGFIQEAVGGRAGSTIGGMLTGAGSGAAMGMMFGPLGMAIGGAVGALGGLVSGLNEAEEAAREKAKAEMESSKGMGSSLASVFSQFPEIKQNLKEFRDQYNKIEALRAEQAGIGSWQTNVIDMESGETETKYVKDPKAQARARAYRKIMSNMVESEFEGALKTLPEDYQFSATAAEEGKTFTGTGKEYIKELEKVSNPKRKTAMYESFIETQKAEEAQQKKLNQEQARGIIIQLNLQKAQIQAQRNAADAQLDIKSKYLQQSNMLDMQEKLMGGLMTEQQKAQLKYNKSINKAAEAFDQAEATANATLKTGILQQVGASQNLQQELKKALSAKGEGAALVQDISDKVAGMSASQLVNTLKNIQKENKGNADIQQAINLLMETELQKRKNSVDLAQRQKDIAEAQASSELKINSILADRKQLLEDMTDRMKEFKDESDFLTQKAALDKRISAAQREGTGYISADRQLQIQRRDMEKYTIPQLKREGISGKTGILSTASGKLNIGGFSAEEEAQILAMGKNADISEIVKAKKAREFEEANRGGKMQQLTNQMQTLAPLSDERFKQITGSSRESVKAQLESLVELDKARTGRNKDLNDEIERTNKALKRQNILNEKNVEAVEKEQAARERMRARMTGPGAFSRGFKDVQGEMRNTVETFNYQLGDVVATNFRDGIAEAMKVGLSGAENLDEALMQVASNFLQAIQNAFLQNAANAIVSAIPMPGGKSRGGSIRNYSRGGGVPAMVTNGEYVMGRDAVNKYGGAFMHGMNAGGSIPGFSNGGAAGSALAANFGGGRGYASGRAYQSRAMSGFFYSQSGNVGLGEDRESLLGILAEEERQRQAAAAKKAKKKALWKQLLGTALSAGISYGVGGGFSGSGGGLFSPKPTGTGTVLKTPSAGWGSVAQGSDLVSDIASGGGGFNPGAMDKIFNIDSRLGPWKPNYYGGSIRKYASGGHIAGKSGIDQIPAMLSEGEYVIRASSARQIGRPMLDRINAGKFNDGGAVSEIAGSSETGSTGGNTNNINISINMERGKAQQSNQDSGGQNPADRSNDEQSSAALADRIKQQVVAVIVEEQRPGGLLDEKS